MPAAIQAGPRARKAYGPATLVDLVKRAQQLKVLVVSIRKNLREVQQAVERLNAGERERTLPHTLSRCLRAIQHDARVLGLERLADFAADAKATGAAVLREDAAGAVELLSEAAAELARVADDLDAGRAHRLDPALAQRVHRAAEAAAGPKRLTPS